MAQQTCDLELVLAALKLLSYMCSPCATKAEKAVFLIHSETGKLAVCIAWHSRGQVLNTVILTVYAVCTVAHAVCTPLWPRLRCNTWSRWELCSQARGCRDLLRFVQTASSVSFSLSEISCQLLRKVVVHHSGMCVSGVWH